MTFDEAFDNASDAHDPLVLERHNYNAARAAIRAGCREGEDADDLSLAEALELSTKGREMLREELAHWRELIAEGEEQTAKQRATWATLDPDLDCVRDEEALSLLDDDEAEDGRDFWAEVKALIE